jgi:hypothetical protein
MSPGSAADREGWMFALLFQQIPAGILCALDLHGGLIQVFACAAGAFWIGVAWILVRRGSPLTSTDCLFIRWGFFPLLATSIVLAVIWCRWWIA